MNSTPQIRGLIGNTTSFPPIYIYMYMNGASIMDYMCSDSED